MAAPTQPTDTTSCADSVESARRRTRPRSPHAQHPGADVHADSINTSAEDAVQHADARAEAELAANVIRQASTTTSDVKITIPAEKVRELSSLTEDDLCAETNARCTLIALIALWVQAVKSDDEEADRCSAMPIMTLICLSLMFVLPVALPHVAPRTSERVKV